MAERRKDGSEAQMPQSEYFRGPLPQAVRVYRDGGVIAFYSGTPKAGREAPCQRNRSDVVKASRASVALCAPRASRSRPPSRKVCTRPPKEMLPGRSAEPIV